MIIKVAKDFSRKPTARTEVEGANSGEKFRETLLVPMLVEAIKSSKKLIVDLDGTAGFGTSFLEEAFGGLIRVNHIEYSDINKTLELISHEEPYLIDDINQYILDAKNEIK